MSPDSFPRMARHVYGSYHRHVIIYMQSHWPSFLGESPSINGARSLTGATNRFLVNFMLLSYFARRFINSRLFYYKELIGLSL